MNARRLALAVGVGSFTLVVIAIPTDLIHNPIFGRQIEATVWAWPVALLTAVLVGVLVALPRPSSCRPATRTGYVGGGLAYLAVGCPTCNHLVVLALGTTGALAWFAPIQPYLALIGLAILGGAIMHRVWLVRGADTTSARL
ncbi:MAG: hypothetical protein JHD05_07570 [Thermoleophilia bacterium]|jgi:hypothetical protein|nr:hypothetical protein [Thermoleophilia bacterium]